MIAPVSIVLQNEDGAAIAGSVLYFDSEGREIGQTGIPAGGTDLTESDIPAGTVRYRFISDGYGWYGTSTLYDSNTITLIREKDTTALLLIGGFLTFMIFRFLK